MQVFPETNAYRVDSDETEWMPFLMKDKEFLEKNNEIWEKKCNRELIQKEKYLKAEKNLITEKSTQKMLSIYSYVSDID